MPTRDAKNLRDAYYMDGSAVYPATGGTSLIEERNNPTTTQAQPEKTGDTPTGDTPQYQPPGGSFQYGSFSYNPYVRSGFSYKDAPEYINRYQAQIDDLANRIQHWQGFNYNYNTDPLYQQYAEAYNRNGQNAMRNTLAQVAARTGGMASSYAGNAAQNTYNEYMQGLNDKIPELYQLAYGMYNDRLNKQRNDLSMLEALEQGDYNKYVDLLGQYNTDRNVAYNVWNTTESSKENADRTKAQYDYNVWKAQQDNAYNQWKYNQDLAYDQWKYQQSAKDADYQAQIKLLQDQIKNGGKGGEEGTTTSDDEMRALYEQMLASGVPKADIYDEVLDAARQGYISPSLAEELKKTYGKTTLEKIGDGIKDAGNEFVSWLDDVGNYINNFRNSGSGNGGGKGGSASLEPDEFEVEDVFRQDLLGNNNDAAAYYSLLQNYKDDPETYKALLENFYNTGRR